MNIQLKTYYRLTKPGIIYGNLLVAVGGFLLAAQGHIEWPTLVAMMVGTSLVIASACVFNNYIDRDIDAKMARTRRRALVSGQVSGSQALTYGTVLGVIGSMVLLWGTNLLTLGLGLLGFVAYVALYGIGKRRTVHGTLIGTISGSVPPVAGYTAVTGQLDMGALLLFAIMVAWQMPHFYAIAMYRLSDYQAAGIPVWPAVYGMRSTKLWMMGYTAMFVVLVVALTATGYASYSFAVVMSGLGLVWLARGWRGFSASDDVGWARRMFGFSLIVLLAMSAMLALSPWLP